MSILLSAYFAEGIVFAADKNLTFRLDQDFTDVEEGAATKVIPWANRRAVAGFCGKAVLAGIPMEEWLRQFAAQTRNFEDISVVASLMHEQIQQDFDHEYPEGADIDNDWLIVHLGGFRYENDIPVPVMYFIRNNVFDSRTGQYQPASREFIGPTDEVLRVAGGDRKPERYQSWLRLNYREGKFLWFNNGTGIAAFNLFKDSIWNVLSSIRSVSPEPIDSSLEDHKAYCAMAVESFNSFFRYHAAPHSRFVGGGVDVEWVSWPDWNDELI